MFSLTRRLHILTRRLLLILKEEELEEWAATVWSLWNAKIRFMHEGFQAHPGVLLKKVQLSFVTINGCR
jgi:hypothetical protein